jgi:hypothetical protein
MEKFVNEGSGEQQYGAIGLVLTYGAMAVRKSLETLQRSPRKADQTPDEWFG